MPIKLTRTVKYALIGGFLIVFLMACGVILVFLNHKPPLKDKDKIFQYGVVFGAAIRSKGRLSATLKSRMDTAILLYKSGTVKKLFLSGAKIGIIKPGEPIAMKNYALSKGVEPSDIILDENGDNTLKTVYHSKKLQSKGSKDASILYISSFFHLARIRVTAKILGVKNYSSYPSENNHPKILYFVFRESIAIWYYIAKASFIRMAVL